MFIMYVVVCPQNNDRAGFELRTPRKHLTLAHAQDNDTTTKNLELTAPSYKAVMNSTPTLLATRNNRSIAERP
jgi:hypothetical protein